MTTYIEHFATLANNKTLTSTDVLIRCLIKAVKAKSDDKVAVAQALIKRAFTPITNRNKLANGTDAWLGFNLAWHRVRYNLTRTGFYASFLNEQELELFKELHAAVK